jgi:hypothetical protein
MPTPTSKQKKLRVRVATLLFLVFAASATILDSSPSAGGEATSVFDGKWDVVLSCPAVRDDEDNAKGYVHRFTAEVRDSLLRGTHGEEGQPNWHLLTGTVAPDGKAELKLDGIVSNPKHAVNNAYRGKPYSYRVRGNFSPSSGSGQRIGKRKCDFQFTRR